MGELKEGVPRTHFRAGWEGRTDLEAQDVEQNYEGRVQVPGRETLAQREVRVSPSNNWPLPSTSCEAGNVSDAGGW